MLALEGNWEALVHTWSFNEIDGANYHPPANERQALWPEGQKVLSLKYVLQGLTFYLQCFPA